MTTVIISGANRDLGLEQNAKFYDYSGREIPW